MTTATDNPTSTSTSSARTRVVCKPKHEVRNIEKYVKSLEGMGVLRDWWDERERYCFEIEKKG